MHGPSCIFWANLTPFSLKAWQGEAECLAASPFGALDDGACIARADAIGDAEFERSFWRRRPVVLSGVSDNAATAAAWSPEYLAREYGHVRVAAKSAYALAQSGGDAADVALAAYLRGMGGGGEGPGAAGLY